MSTIPEMHRALVLTSRSSPPEVKSIPVPSAGPGSALVQIEVANVLSYSREVYSGIRPYTFPTPLVTGMSAIGRIASIGPDATLLKVGDLVLIDSTIRGRDDPDSAICLSGIHDGFTAGSKKLMAGEWRDSTFAEYAKVPLENCFVLNEARLLSERGLGYSVANLAEIPRLLVPYGGLRDIGLRAGETIVISPATGSFGGAAVEVALSIGARCIAMGRDVGKLEKVKALNPERIVAVPITGDVEADCKALKEHGPIDAFFDISPPMAATSTHFKSAVMALRHKGRVSLMGGIIGDVSLPHSVLMHHNITLKGCWMYPREAVGEVIKMTECGILMLGPKAGHRNVGTFGLEQWDSAFKAAEENAARGEQVLIKP